MKNLKVAWIAGGTGLVGSFLLDELLASDNYERVVSVARRASGRLHRKLVERIAELMEMNLGDVPAPDDIFCTLGTTIKKAGSQEKFREVDLLYPLKLAEAAKAAGARQFLLVSSVGANQQSRNFYLRTKGEVEAAISALGFDAVHIFRPSMLLGPRSEIRLAERIATPFTIALAPLMVGGVRKYRPIQAADVARAMVSAAQNGNCGVQIREYEAIKKLAAH